MAVKSSASGYKENYFYCYINFYDTVGSFEIFSAQAYNILLYLRKNVKYFLDGFIRPWSRAGQFQERLGQLRTFNN